jgi:hypothetical protein
MKSSKPQSLTPESLIGTKWVAVNSDNGNTIEIVEKTYCLYTSPNRVELHTYKICGDKILIRDSIQDFISYVIKDNTFFLNDTPLYVKE